MPCIRVIRRDRTCIRQRGLPGKGHEGGPIPTIHVSMGKEGQIVKLIRVHPRKGQDERIIYRIDIGKNALAAHLPIKESEGISGGWVCPLSGLYGAIK